MYFVIAFYIKMHNCARNAFRCKNCIFLDFDGDCIIAQIVEDRVNDIVYVGILYNTINISNYIMLNK